MPREYRHIQQYEKEIIELWEQGKTLREIAEKFGFSKEQVQEFKTRYISRSSEICMTIVLLLTRPVQNKT